MSSATNGNIAHTCCYLKDNKKAIAYYEKVLKYTDEAQKEFAEKQLAELKKVKIWCALLNLG